MWTCGHNSSVMVVALLCTVLQSITKLYIHMYSKSITVFKYSFVFRIFDLLGFGIVLIKASRKCPPFRRYRAFNLAYIVACLLCRPLPLASQYSSAHSKIHREVDTMEKTRSEVSPTTRTAIIDCDHSHQYTLASQVDISSQQLF